MLSKMTTTGDVGGRKRYGTSGLSLATCRTPLAKEVKMTTTTTYPTQGSTKEFDQPMSKNQLPCSQKVCTTVTSEPFAGQATGLARKASLALSQTRDSLTAAQQMACASALLRSSQNYTSSTSEATREHQGKLLEKRAARYSAAEVDPLSQSHF